MTTEELEQFKALIKKYEPKDLEEVKKAIQTDMHPVFQDINDGGRTAGTAAQKAKVTEAEDKLKAEQAAHAATKAKLEELNGQAPEAAKLKASYEAEVDKLRKESDEKLSLKDRELLEERLETAKAGLITELDKLGIDREYSSTILANRADVIARIKPGPKGKADVLKAGSTDVTLVAPDGKTPLRLLAEELEPTVANTWKKSSVARGSATSGSSGGSGSQPATHYETIKKEQQDKLAAEKKTKSGRSALERLGGRSR